MAEKSLPQDPIHTPSGVAPTSHAITFPFPLLNSKLEGGLPRIVQQEIELSGGRKNVTIFSSDKHDGVYGAANIVGATPGELPKDLLNLWFGTGQWSLLHPAAHTSATLSPDALSAMYSRELSAPILEELDRAGADSRVGSVEFLIKFVERYAPDFQFALDFNRRFSPKLSELKAGTVMNWQDYFFDVSVSEHSEAFRQRGIYQTWHLHTTLPNNLKDSEWGRFLLATISKVDRIYSYSQQYNDDVAIQLRECGLRVPEFRIFEYGLDTRYYDRALEVVDSQTYTKAPGFSSLSDEQKEFISESFRAAKSIPFRFLSADRSDPGKGITVLQDGIEMFLDSLGLSREQLGKTFRFGFLTELYPVEKADPRDVKQSYNVYVTQRHRELMKKFGSAYRAVPSLGGDARILIPSLMHGCHGMTGGSQDGFNIAMMENAYINRKEPTSLICGSGAGFAIEASRRGFNDSAFFFEAGNPQAVADALRSIYSETASKEMLGQQKHRLVHDFILKRNGTLLVSPD